MVDTYEGRKRKANGQHGENRRAAIATSGSTRFGRMLTLYRCLRCGDLRSPGVTERLNAVNGPLRLREDDDDDDDDYMYSERTLNTEVAGLEIASDYARARQSAVVDGGDND